MRRFFLVLGWISTFIICQNVSASCDVYVPSLNHFYSEEVGGKEWAPSGYSLPDIGDANLDEMVYSILTSKGYRLTFLENLPLVSAPSDRSEMERFASENLQKSYPFLKDEDHILAFNVYFQGNKKSKKIIYFAIVPSMRIVEYEDEKFTLRETYSQGISERLNWWKQLIGKSLHPERSIKKTLEYFPTCSELGMDY